jgi:DNA mismatch repair protein MSH3
MVQATRERLTQAPAAGVPHSANGGYTPLEQQVVALKQKHQALDCLMAFEVGYKFMFFGEDASVVSRELSIVAYPKHSFLVAGIPVERLKVHLRRLVEADHKVGVLRQSETRAIKVRRKGVREKCFGGYA